MNTRGEILYSNAVVLVEGETEEQAVTRFLREYFKVEPFELGINVVGVGGSNYPPFIKIMNRLGIKWYIFSDGESEPVKKMTNSIKKALDVDDIDISNLPNVFVLENQCNFETYLIAMGYINQIKSAILSFENNNDFIVDYIETHNDSKCKGGKKTRKYKLDADGGIKRATQDIITLHKTKYAYVIADEICSMPKRGKRIPPKFRLLFDKIKLDLQN